MLTYTQKLEGFLIFEKLVNIDYFFGSIEGFKAEHGLVGKFKHHNFLFQNAVCFRVRSQIT